MIIGIHQETGHSIRRICATLNLPRSSYYHAAIPTRRQLSDQELGKQITDDYPDQAPHFVAVLNGAFIFAADLIRAAELSSTISFVKLSSYDGLSSTGKVKTDLSLSPEQVKGQHLIIVEDIVDTGKTLHSFINDLKAWEPASIKIAALLLKPEALQHPPV